MRRPASYVFLAALTMVVAGTFHAPAAVADRGSHDHSDHSAHTPPRSSRMVAKAHDLAERDARTMASPLVAKDATMTLRDLYLARPGLSGAERRDADALLSRPTDPPRTSYDVAYVAGTPVVKTCSARLCVQYVATTDDAASAAYADQTLAVLENAWTQEIDLMGFRPPATDGQLGGDERFDVYLANISDDGLYGFCAPENPVPGSAHQASSYCVLDNDMMGFPMDPMSSLRVTAAHEFFHAIQFNYDADEDPWVMEATATWMEEQVENDINDNRQFIPGGQLGRPREPLDMYSQGSSMYGNWLFIQRLSQSYGQGVVKELWERLDGSPGARNAYSTQGIAQVLAAHGSNFKKFYGYFVSGNHTPRTAYAEGSSYRASPVSKKARFNPRHRTFSIVLATPHLSANSVRFKPVHRSRKLMVRVKARRGAVASPVARALVFYRNGQLDNLQIRLNRRGAGHKTLPFKNARVRKVIVVTANASLRFRGCGSRSVYSCGGYPKDDRQSFAVTARIR